MTDHDVTFIVEITDAVDTNLTYLKRKWIRVSSHTRFRELFTALCGEVTSGYHIHCVKVNVGCKHAALDPGHFVQADPDYPVRIVNLQEANFVQFIAEQSRNKITDCVSRLPLQITLPRHTKQVGSHVTGFVKQTFLTALTLAVTGLVSVGWYMATLYITLSMRFLVIPLLSYATNRWSGLTIRVVCKLKNVLLLTGGTLGKRWRCLFDKYLAYPKAQWRHIFELL